MSTSMDRGSDRGASGRAPGPRDDDSRDVLSALGGAGERRDEAVAHLRALLLHAARFEVARRRASLPALRGDELDELAREAAADALVEVLRHLDDLRDGRRVSTWVYKFALREAWSTCVEAAGRSA